MYNKKMLTKVSNIHNIKNGLRILLFVLICSVTCIMIRSISLGYNSEHLQKEQVIFENLHKKVETQFNNISQLYKILSRDEAMHRFMTNETNRSYATIFLQNRIAFYGDCLEDSSCLFGVMRRSWDSVVMANTVIPYEDFKKQYGVDSTALNMALNKLYDGFYFEPSLISLNDGSGILYTMCDTYSFAEPMVFFAVLDLSMLDYEGIQNNTAVILLDNEVVFSKGSLAKYEIMPMLENGKKFIMKSAAVSSSLFERTISFGIVEQKPLISFRAKQMVFYFLIIIFSWFISVRLSDYILRKLYGPVNEIGKLINGGIEHSENSDIRYLLESIKKLVSSNQTMKSELERCKVISFNKMHKDLLYGIADYSQNLFDFEINAGSNVFVVLIAFKRIDNVNTEKNISKEQFINIIDVKNFVFMDDIDKQSYALVLKNMSSKQFTDIIISRYSDRSDFVLIVGKEVESINQLHESFRSAVQELECINVKSALGHIIDTNILRMPIYGIDNNTLNLIEKAVVNGENEAVYKGIDDLIGVYFFNGYIEKRAVIDFSAVVNTILADVLKNSKIRYDEIFNENVRDKLDLCQTVDDIRSCVQDMFDKIIDIFVKRKEDRDTSLKKSIDSYITQNYKKDISLTDISLYLGFSEGYTCSVLKRCYNKTFREILSNHRYLMARNEVKSDPSVTLQELSIRVGVNNATSFRRLIRKYGFTHYREFKADCLK